ncbi:DEKNAAC101162 [Brettanomyces naardenensis]|uniref:DEKNAAC101162 n=1 Tax=Brettanomyces naardenensis TaxID=13370 RepID=A0A448YHC4_BRENA|nr:DEKNAAC101162 [Brettanomyces naardenensis]
MSDTEPYVGDRISVHDSDSAQSDSQPYEGFDDGAERAVRGLAREISRQSRFSTEGGELSPSTTGGVGTGTARSELLRTITSMSQVHGVVPYDITENGGIDPRLDPDSDKFDSRFWVKNMRKMLDSDLGYYRPTSLGVAYKNLCAKGISSDADFQPTVANIVYKQARDAYFKYFRSHDESRYFDILKPMDALIEPGTVTVVLGRPGAGCSTLLRTIACQTYGFKVDPASVISYDGLTPKDIEKHYRGEVVYSAETDSHFPHLTVGQTLEFAASLRTPENRPAGITREQYAKHMTKVFMATYGLSHTFNTKVGNDFIRGVSGGERKRVSIAEVSLCGSNLQCWDNATRGLDAATALEFVKALKVSAALLDTNALIAIYQCSQDAYDLFDNVILLYEGRQIYYGAGTEAKQYFERMGYSCPQRQTTADFLTSITSPAERRARKGWENKVPRTPEEFEAYWRKSPEYTELINKIDSYFERCHELNTKERYHEAHVAKQSKHSNPKSPFRVSYSMQIKSIMRRNVYRFQGDPSITVFAVVANTIMGLILSSLFYNLPSTTGAFYYRTAALFFAVLFNAFSSLNEVMGLYEARDIVEKHKKYALYHPSADAFASVITELFPKILTCIAFNLIYYFMVNFRRDPGHFFFYLLLNFVATLLMSNIFRSIGSYYRTLSESMTPSAIILLALVIYTGFVLPTPSMHGWSRWINYLDPIAYVFEALVANEFSGQEYKCSSFVPAYDDAPMANKVCPVVSALPGQEYVSGSAYIYDSFRYTASHKWRDFGIAVSFAVFFLFVYLLLVETNRGAMQKGEIIVFQRSTLKKLKKENKLAEIVPNDDIEAGYSSGEKPAGIKEETESGETDDGVGKLIAGKDIFHWRDVCYEVQIKSETRRILEHVDGWVKPGTLTALMGASGAGKTTLLDVLANRVTMGVVSGQMFVNGRLRDESFQRSTGYVQQQDLHLQTTTVREALRFSAYLRQPQSVSREEKEDYVENVIRILEMEKYADAIVGVAGEGLNVEQRKRLTIGVELAAKPKLLLFLDEPTSGLDSQTAWSICQLMRKLANNGQAILCTIHQPSAILMQEFDRLLFLAKGGRTVYFGDLGKNCQTLINYFESHGAASCPASANPAEWMLEVIGAAPGSHALQDYHEVWIESDERKAVRAELQEMEEKLVEKPVDDSKEAKREFASDLWLQYVCVTKRVFQQYWRTPSYIWAKLLLTVLTSLFNGFSFFKAGTSLQGMQNQMLAIFMFTIVLGTLINQMLPQFVYQRDLYEVRERPSKTFSWKVFLAAQVSVEIPWNVLMGTIGYFCWYYAIGFYENTIETHTTAERGALIWLLIITFFVYAGTLGQATIAGVQQKENAAHISMLLFTMGLNFCGVLYYPTGFWSFMYRVSPFTYWVSSMLSTGIGRSAVHCLPNELVSFPPPEGMTCGAYMEKYISAAGGYLEDSNATQTCEFCSLSSTDTYLASLHISYDNRWRDWGIFFCYVVINELFMLSLYWLVRVPKKNDRVKDESQLKSVAEKPVNELPEEK